MEPAFTEPLLWKKLIRKLLSTVITTSLLENKVQTKHSSLHPMGKKLLKPPGPVGQLVYPGCLSPFLEREMACRTTETVKTNKQRGFFFKEK